MGWCGYGIYDGDDTQTRHYDFIKWAGIKMDEDDLCDCFGDKTVLPKEEAAKLGKPGYTEKILKKMPKDIRDEYDAIEWQMLLALYADNKIVPPLTVIIRGLDANDYLMGEHADEFDEPGKRRNKLRAFRRRVEKLYGKYISKQKRVKV